MILKANSLLKTTNHHSNKKERGMKVVFFNFYFFIKGNSVQVFTQILIHVKSLIILIFCQRKQCTSIYINLNSC